MRLWEGLWAAGERCRAAQGGPTSDSKLLCWGAAGWEPELRETRGLSALARQWLVGAWGAAARPCLQAGQELAVLGPAEAACWGGDDSKAKSPQGFWQALPTTASRDTAVVVGICLRKFPCVSKAVHRAGKGSKAWGLSPSQAPPTSTYQFLPFPHCVLCVVLCTASQRLVKLPAFASTLTLFKPESCCTKKWEQNPNPLSASAQTLGSA